MAVLSLARAYPTPALQVLALSPYRYSPPHRLQGHQSVGAGQPYGALALAYSGSSGAPTDTEEVQQAKTQFMAAFRWDTQLIGLDKFDWTI